MWYVVTVGSWTLDFGSASRRTHSDIKLFSSKNSTAKECRGRQCYQHWLARERGLWLKQFEHQKLESSTAEVLRLSDIRHFKKKVIAIDSVCQIMYALLSLFYGNYLKLVCILSCFRLVVNRGFHAQTLPVSNVLVKVTPSELCHTISYKKIKRLLWKWKVWRHV